MYFSKQPYFNAAICLNVAPAFSISNYIFKTTHTEQVLSQETILYGVFIMDSIIDNHLANLSVFDLQTLIYRYSLILANSFTPTKTIQMIVQSISKLKPVFQQHAQSHSSLLIQLITRILIGYVRKIKDIYQLIKDVFIIILL